MVVDDSTRFLRFYFHSSLPSDKIDVIFESDTLCGAIPMAGAVQDYPYLYFCNIFIPDSLNENQNIHFSVSYKPKTQRGYCKWETLC